ncbi:hypothetical protein [Bacillus cereus]|uniref:hypothetical protein n=1 Tax=Bacillus cereus TaxID=1396 RepID=UPI0015D4B1E4|nr:hypothetical protein [Bacillus cereus]
MNKYKKCAVFVFTIVIGASLVLIDMRLAHAQTEAIKIYSKKQNQLIKFVNEK